MSSYRDDLKAAKARISVLENELDALAEGKPIDHRSKGRRELVDDVQVAPPAPVGAGGSSPGIPEWLVSVGSCLGALVLFAALTTAVFVVILMLVRCGTG
ncbi:MAG: hypothetical protein JRI68_15660 [Deltaproteobacteria bacterium]|nr:hypothetical protein [Deltaproteobacteria bacterium]